MYNKSQQNYNNTLSLLGIYSLQEVHDDKTRIYSGLSYATEANTLLNGVEKK